MNLKDAFWNWVVTHAQTIQYVDMHLACLEMWVEWIPIRIRQLFVTLPGLNTGIYSPIMRVSLQNDRFGTIALTVETHRSSSTQFWSVTNLHFVAVHPSSSFPASLEAGLSHTRILPRKSLGHQQQIVDCKVRLCTSLRTVAEFL